MMVVLAVIVVISMLGYMGIELAGRDTSLSGTYLDIVSRDVANRSALELGLARMNANPARTAQQLQLFVADSSKTLASSHHFVNLSQPSCSLQVSDPGFYALEPGSDQSAVKVQVVSVDLGSSATGSGTGDGIKLTLLVTGRGRNGDLFSSISSYKVTGLDVPAGSAGGAPSLDYAVYINGNLPNSNVGTRVSGNMYVSGDVSLNGPATIDVTGTLRIGGSLTSNAPLTVAGNAVIGKDVYSNGSAALTFQKNLVLGGAFQTLNAPITVAGNMEVQSTPVSTGPWGSNANLTVGGQLWVKSFCSEIKAKVAVGGDAFFDNCLYLNTSGIVNSFSNLYIRRGGGTATNTFSSGTVNVSGNLGSWATGGSFWIGGATMNVAGGLLLKQPLDLDNRLNVTGAIQLHAGISDIGNGASNALTGSSLYLKANGQRGDFNGGVTIDGPITSKGSLDANFSNNGGNSRWSIAAGAANRTWLYENGSAFNSGNAPRVANATTTNANGWRAINAIATPADLFAAPAPVAATNYAANPYTAEDLDLGSGKGWNQVYTVDSSKLKSVWTELTDAAIAAAGAQSGSWTIADWNKIYNKYKRADGWLIAHFPSSGCNLSGLNPPGGTFTGKAIWIVDRSINVNGNWPGSTSSNDIQMIYVRGSSGQLGAFGTPSNLTGYVHFENPFNGQMQWGANVTLTGALHLKGIASGLTGNSGGLQIVGSQSVLDQIQAAVPNLFGLPSPGSASPTPVFTSSSAGSSNLIVVRQPVLYFWPWGFYR